MDSVKENLAVQYALSDTGHALTKDQVMEICTVSQLIDTKYFYAGVVAAATQLEEARRLSSRSMFDMDAKTVIEQIVKSVDAVGDINKYLFIWEEAGR